MSTPSLYRCINCKARTSDYCLAGMFFHSLQASSLHRALVSAATLILHSWAVDPAAQRCAPSVTRLLRTLCEALARAHALLEGNGAFVMLCMRELRESMETMKAQPGEGEG